MTIELWGGPLHLQTRDLDHGQEWYAEDVGGRRWHYQRIDYYGIPRDYWGPPIGHMMARYCDPPGNPDVVSA